jgi:putative transposase
MWRSPSISPRSDVIAMTVSETYHALLIEVGSGRGSERPQVGRVGPGAPERCVEDACMVVCDGLKGLPESIEAAWPLAIVETCVPHLNRNTFRLASRADWDKMARDLRPVYTAVNEADAAGRLDEFHSVWGTKYWAIKGLWSRAWPEFVPFLDYSPKIRRVIYSTNAIESLNARFRRATRALPQRASSVEVPLPRRQIPGSERHRPGTLDEPLEARPQRLHHHLRRPPLLRP